MSLRFLSQPGVVRGTESDWLRANAWRPSGLLRQLLNASMEACPETVVGWERKHKLPFSRLMEVRWWMGRVGFRAIATHGVGQFCIEYHGPGMSMFRDEASPGHWQRSFVQALPEPKRERFLSALAYQRGQAWELLTKDVKTF